MTSQSHTAGKVAPIGSGLSGVLLFRPSQECVHSGFERWDPLSFGNANLALSQCSSVSRFNLPSDAGIALLCAPLYVLPAEDEVIPVHVAALEYGHQCASLYVLVFVQLVELPR